MCRTHVRYSPIGSSSHRHRCPGGVRPGSAGVQAMRATGRSSTLLLRRWPIRHDPSWSAAEVGLEDLVLAYMDGGR